MFETLNIINKLSEKGIKIVFIRQPELSTTGQHTKLLLAIYSSFCGVRARICFVTNKVRPGCCKSKRQIIR